MGGPHTDSVNSNVDGYAAVSQCACTERQERASERVLKGRRGREGLTRTRAHRYAASSVVPYVKQYDDKRSRLFMYHGTCNIVQHVATQCNKVKPHDNKRSRLLMYAPLLSFTVYCVATC